MNGAFFCVKCKGKPVRMGEIYKKIKKIIFVLRKKRMFLL